VITIWLFGRELFTLAVNQDQTEQPETITRSIGFAAAEPAERAAVGWIPDEHYR